MLNLPADEPLSTCTVNGYHYARHRSNLLIVSRADGRGITDQREAKTAAEWYWLHVGTKGNDPQRQTADFTEGEVSGR